MTIYDIAQIAGVSASTVSRVMNDKPGVGEATRKKIKEIMQEHHFQPSEAAQNLATNSTRVVACFMATIRQSHHSDRYTTINKILTEEGFSCIHQKHRRMQSWKYRHAKTWQGSSCLAIPTRMMK